MSKNTPSGTAEIEIIFCVKPDELHCHYQGQFERQNAFVALNLENGHLYASYNGEIGGGIPMSVYHGQTRRYPIPVLTADAANRLLREIRPLTQRILSDWDNEWDGSNNNAVLGEDACKAEDEIEALTDSGQFDLTDLVQEIDAGDWMQYGDDDALAAEHDITADTTDARAAEIAEEITRGEARSGDYGYTVINGIEGYLRDLRDQIRERRAIHQEHQQGEGS